MIKQCTIVKGVSRSADNPTISGEVTRTKRHHCEATDVEVILAEVLLQEEGFNRAIYAYAGDKFYIIKEVDGAPYELALT